MSKPETVLEEAQRIIYGDREKTYGHPSKNFENTAMFWRAWLISKRGLDVPFDVEDVAMMMALLKLARQAHAHKRDNLVDLNGYVACIQKVLDHGIKTRNDVLPERAPAPEPKALPAEDVQPLRRGTDGPLVLGGGIRSVDRVQVHDSPKAAEDRGPTKPVAASGRLVDEPPYRG